MCAITGILRRDGGPAPREVISRMTDQLGHRGPDGDGIAIRGPVAFGHRRLSIIDPEGGRQPMFNEDGNVWVTFNGEIYNYRELAEELKSKGHQFRSSSDTETIVHAWEEWGEDCLKRLRGMFAFAVMDWRAGRLFVARDQLGIKPLHYIETPEYFAFSSEPQALRLVPGFNCELSFDAIDQFLWLQYIPAPSSIYDQASKLPPGHCLTVNLSGRVPKPKEYWRMNFEADESRTEEQWIEEADAVIGDSVRAHLVSDVPFGAFLSGGVDSSLVVANMSEALGQPVRAFSIGFDEDEFNETPYAAQAAKRCGADHTIEIVRPDALEVLTKLVGHYGEPFGDSSAVPTFYVSELARRHVPMVLSGDGADELFSGYWSHGHFLNFCDSTAGRPPQLSDWLQFIHYTDVATRQSLWRPEWRSHCPSRLDAFPQAWEQAIHLSPANKAQYLDLKTYLPFDILTKVDVASMAHGLEVRTPFVDMRVAELAARIPDRFNIQRGANGDWERKCLLRKVAGNYFGDAFVNRPKMGFAMPFANWVAPGGKLHDAVTQKLLGNESSILPYFNPNLIQQFLKTGAFGPLWLLLFLEEWLRYHNSAPRWTDREATPVLTSKPSDPPIPSREPTPVPFQQPKDSMRIRSVQTVSELRRVLNLPSTGKLLEDDLDVVDTDCDHFSRKRRDAEALCTIAANVHGNCLDLGTSHGRSAFKLGTNLADGFKVFTVNILPEQFDDSSGKLITHLLSKEDIGCYYRDAGLQNIEQHYADTSKWQIADEIDGLAMAFVDAAHDEELVYSDSKLVYDRIAPGGYLCWHDFCPELRHKHHWIDDCMRGVERFIKDYGLSDTEVVHMKDSWVAILRKPEVDPVRVTLNTAGRDPMDQDMRQLRYVYVYPNYGEDRVAEEDARIARIRSWGYDAVAYPIDCPGGWWHFPKLDAAWKQRDPFLISQYDNLLEFLTGRDVLISSGGSMLHPEFIAQLQDYTVFTCSDDPEFSEVLSKPAAPAFDYSFCINVACLDDYRGWGCRNVGWFYHAADPTSVWPGLTEEKILNGERDIDIALLCERVFNLSNRADRVGRLVKEFPNAFVRGRGWPGGHVAPAPIYGRTKIGWNLHNSIGPCNSRLITLPANGILQICDNKSHLGTLFKLDEEVIGFDSIEECIDKTRYYLAHDDERRVVAAAGWKRVQLEYTEQKQFERVLEQIKDDYFSKCYAHNSTAAPLSQSPTLFKQVVGNEAPATTEVAPGMFNQAVAESEPISAKPKIHLVADVADWIFARHCAVISSALGDEFDFDMGLQNHPYNEDDYDLIYPLEWNLITQDQIKNPAKYITGIRSHTSWKDHNFKFFAKYLNEHFGTVHVVSEKLRDIFEPVLPGVRSLTHGVDTRFFKTNKAVNSTEKKLRIGWAGNRVNPTKGFEQIIKPLGDLKGVELVYCGYMDRKLELPEMREFYESIDAYVCSSELEGNNNSLMEAAAMERAIITTDNGTVPEYLTDGQSALIVERKTEAFVLAVEKLRDNPELRVLLGRAARKSVVEKFEWRQMLEQHRVLFREALLEADPVEKASANVHKALELDPNNIDALKLLQQIQVQREDWPAASLTGEAILTRLPDDVDTIMAMAKCFYEAGDIETARVSLEHILELDPENELARQNLADLGGDESELSSEIETAIRAGMESLQQDNPADALTHYRRALDLGLQNPEIEQMVNQLEHALGADEQTAAQTELKSGWSFCVITNGKKPDKLKATLESIRATGFETREILVGGEPPEGLGDDVTIVPVVDGARNGRLGEMRNRLTERAQYDRLVVCDDDMLFHGDFAAGIQNFGENWQVLCVRLLNLDGSRYWDWATHGGPKGHSLLDYDETDSHTYVTGGLCIMKAEVGRNVKWDEGRGFYEDEDLDFSSRLHDAGISISFNRYSTVTHDDDRYTQNDNLVVRRLEGDRPKDPELPVRWFGPVFNPSGYASEAIDFLVPLADRLNLGLKHHNPIYSEKFVNGLAPEEREKLFNLRDRFGSLDGGIVINHNPANGFFRPPNADYCIGRTMYETDRIPPEWVAACNRMDEIWVPSKFNLETFANSGVERDKLVVIPGAVDSTFFDPTRHEALELPNKAAYNFLSIFEWSSRKAWDVILTAYLREFSADDDVCLYLRTYQFGRPDGDPAAALWREVREFAATLNLGDKEWPRIELLTEQVSSHELPRLYKAVDCLVGISRGEGWGRPHHEAMSMGLPVLATNWSGNTEFMTEDTAVLIDYELVEARGLEPEIWHYKGHMWADPCEAELGNAMRQLQSQPEAGEVLGRQARAHVVAHYSREAVAEKVIRRLSEIENKLNFPSLPACHNVDRLDSLGAGMKGLLHSRKPLSLAWEGSFLDRGSLSHVNRELSGRLAEMDGIKVTRVGKNALPPLANPELKRVTRSLKNRSKENTQITVRHNWPPDWSEVRSGIRIHCQPWEFGSLPAEWLEEVDKVDQVWAYTEYVRRVYVESGVDPAKVKVVPLGINPDRFNPDAVPISLATKKTFKFLFVGGTIHRKGIDLLLQAYLEVFDSKDDVCLVIKDFGGTSFYKGQTMADEIEVARMGHNAPEILYLDCEMADEDMAGLYTACDCIVHPYRGEGFGLPVLEGMACGLPAIVTGGGATDDFAVEPYVWRLPATKQRVGHSVSGMQLDGNGWLLQPCVNSLKKFLFEAYADPAQVSAKGEAASRHVRSHWSWEKAAEIAALTAQQAWEKRLEEERRIQKLRSRQAKVVLPDVARLGELSDARALLEKRQFEPAWRAVTHAVQLRPFHPEAWTMLAEIAREAGDASIARKCVSYARAMAPGYHRARKLEKSLRKSGKINSQAWMKMPPCGGRLSVIMIARDEATFIGDCLRSVKDVADQIIVVDTGSTDETAEIADSFGAELHHMNWADDFSVARNEALIHARGDWILFIDADEELMPEGEGELRSAMSRSDTLAWRLPIIDAGREHLGKSHVPRLFRNAPGLFFLGRIHEQVSSSVEVRRAEWGLQHRIGGPSLFHRGYQDGLVKDRRKQVRNIRLLELAVEEFPNDANLLMNLGLELAKSGQAQAALGYYAEAFSAFGSATSESQTPELREALVTQFATQLLGQGQTDAALSVLLSPLASSSALTASQEFLLGLAHLRLSDHKLAASAFRNCLKKRHEPSLTPASGHVVGAAVDHCLALCLSKLGDEKAEEHFDAAFGQDPDSIPLCVDFARYLASRGDTVHALQVLHGVIGDETRHLPVWQLGGDIALREPMTVQVAEDWICEAERFYPTDRLIRRQKAEVMLLSGRSGEAGNLWRDLAEDQMDQGFEAIAAYAICSLVAGRNFDCPQHAEKTISEAFIDWYRRLIAFQQNHTIEQVNLRIAELDSVLPTAAGLLRLAFDDAQKQK